MSRARRILVVTNPGSESECEEEEPQIRYNHWPNPLSQQRPSGTSLYHGKSSYACAPSPPINSPDNSSNPFYPGSWSNPTLSSPSSSDSRTIDTTPPPVTPSMASPPIDLIDDSPKESNFSIGASDRDSSLQLPLPSLQATVPASYNRPSNQLQARQLANPSPRVAPVRPSVVLWSLIHRLPSVSYLIDQ